MEREEAIEVIRKNYPHVGVSGTEFETALRELIPELKESEDERIRKEIRNFLIDMECKEEWINYLEKQKEQKPDYCHHEVDLSGCSDEYRKAYYDGWNNCNQQHAQLQAEQKPAEWSEEDEKKIHFLSRLIEFQVKNDEYCFSEGRFVSKKEAIKMLKSLRPCWKPSEEQMEALKNSAYGTYQNGDGPALRELYEQLKKL